MTFSPLVVSRRKDLLRAVQPALLLVAAFLIGTLSWTACFDPTDSVVAVGKIATTTPVEVSLATTTPMTMKELWSDVSMPTSTTATDPATATISARRPSHDKAGTGLENATVLSVVDVVKRLRPSVVHISARVDPNPLSNRPVPTGVGTGILLDAAGYIVTNSHVLLSRDLKKPAEITVTLANGEVHPAILVGYDYQTDVALIRIEADRLIPAPLGKSSELEVGEDVIAIGHALGLPGGPTVSKGVVSALNRSLLIDPTAQIMIIGLIQTDASINQGNSGGPLVSVQGEVVGINTANLNQGYGIGFAINMDDVVEVVSQLMEFGFVRRGYLGVRVLGHVTQSLAEEFNLSVSSGVIIEPLSANTVAAIAGMRVGDIIIRMNQTLIDNTGQMARFLMDHPPGETVDVAFVRGRNIVQVTVTLEDRPQ